MGTVVATTPGTNSYDTADLVGFMAGLAGGITPTTSGRVLFLITAMLRNSTIGDGAAVQIRFGSGAAPAAGDAPTGTAVGSVKHMVAATAAGVSGVSLAFTATGLTVGTPYWFDLSLAAITGGHAYLSDVDLVAIEM
jgi:hypothetical protein